MTERNELGAKEALMDLIFFALDHGTSSVEGGGPLIPFVVFEQGMDEGLVFAQRYEPKRLLRKARPVGNPAYIRNSENLLGRNSGA